MPLSEEQNCALGRGHLRSAAIQSDTCAALERYILALEARIGHLEAQFTVYASGHILDGEPVHYTVTYTPPPAQPVHPPILVRIPWSGDWRKGGA